MRSGETQSHYPQRVRIRVARGVPAAIGLAARRRNTSPSSWAREVLLRGLEADGVRLCDGLIENAQRPATVLDAIDPRGLERPKGI
jgi:hypothetical protein